MLQVINYFKCLSDETRLRCMLLLHREGELCVCEITHALDLSQPKISRHLALLRQSGLLSDDKKGQWVYYKINPVLPEWVGDFLKETVIVVEETSVFQQDILRLQRMTDRPDGEKFCE